MSIIGKKCDMNVKMTLNIWHWPECVPFRPVAGDWPECVPFRPVAGDWPECRWPERHGPEGQTSNLCSSKYTFVN
jgi:hypothetical protein